MLLFCLNIQKRYLTVSLSLILPDILHRNDRAYPLPTEALQPCRSLGTVTSIHKIGEIMSFNYQSHYIFAPCGPSIGQ